MSSSHRGAVKRLVCLSAIVLLLSCGGAGEDPASTPKSASADERAKAKAVFVPTTPIPADANLKGMWSPVTG